MKKNFSSPLISVIMNCHNGEQYLKKSIKSIISQNYKNWELIFWNNRSIDNSKKIFKSFKDKRLRYFESKKFQKLYEARNFAIKKAKGKYICFLDTDDWWVNCKLKNQIDLFLKDKNLKFIYTNFYSFKQKKGIAKIAYNELLPEGSITQKLLNKYCIGILTVMLKKEIFNKDLFNTGYNIIGDFDFFLRLSKKYKIKCIQQPLAYYRLHNKNYSRLKINEQIKETSAWLKKIKNEKNNNKYSFIHVEINQLKLRVKELIRRIFNSY